MAAREDEKAMEVGDNDDLKRKVSGIEGSKAVLARLLRVSKSLESYRHGLAASLQMGHLDQKFSARAMQLFEKMSKEIAALPNDQVTLRLTKLNTLVRTTLAVVLEEVEQLDERNPETIAPERLDLLDDLLSNFKRQAQTAVTLYVLLDKRGISFPPPTFSIPRNSLTEKFKTVARQEKAQKGKILEQIDTMEDEIKAILVSPNCPQHLAGTMKSVLKDLRENRNHIDAGGAISALPIPMDSFESEEEVVFESEQETGAASETTPEPEAASEPEEEDPLPPRWGVDYPEKQTAPEPAGLRPGFWGLVWEWLNTPRGVSFKDIKARYESGDN